MLQEVICPCGVDVQVLVDHQLDKVSNGDSHAYKFVFPNKEA